jgi:uncharacterized YccA/Bax inhibitor family protein
MSMRGTFAKTAMLLALTLAAAIFSWSNQYVDPAAVGVKLGIFSLIGFVLAIVTTFRMDWSPYTAPAYAFVEGLVLGTLSRLFNFAYPGLVVQAVALTFAVFASMLFLYNYRIIRVTDRMRTMIFAATMAIAIVYLGSMLLQFFGVSAGFLHSPSPFSILFSLIVIAIAALNLVIHFDFVERVSHFGAPKFMEWYAAFGLILTLVWLYIEIVSLLAKLRDR